MPRDEMRIALIKGSAKKARRPVMDKKPQMICPSAEKCPTQYMNCPHREQHTEIISGSSACQKSCYNDVKCIPYVEPSPKVCTTPESQETCLHLTPSEEDCAGCPDFKQPEPIPLRQQFEDACMYYGCCPYDALLDRLEVIAIARDQQVRKDLIEECIKTIELRVSQTYQGGDFEHGRLEERHDIVAHLRAMAEEK